MLDDYLQELEAAGWLRLGERSGFWQAPDDQGPSSRKWTFGQAHSEMLRRLEINPQKRAAPRKKAATKTTE